MNKEQLAPWIEKLTKAEPKDRNAIVGEMCKENKLKIGDAWKLLKEAGYDPKAMPPADGAPQGNDQQSGATLDSTGASPAAGADAHPSGNTPPTPEQKPPKKRIKHEKLKGKNLIAGNKMIAFDADGIAELDAADAERLLTIPGYTEVGQE
jgi:hypothetical protein